MGPLQHRLSGRTPSSSASPAARGRRSRRRAISARSTSARVAKLWRFRTVPAPGEFGHETWAADSWKNRGGANAWGGLSVDVERGLVFAGLGSASFDFYGGDRHGENLFANCTIALDANTGNRVWHFQTLRHDLWDHDLPVYPNLVTVTHNGRRIDAVAQVTKTGYVYLFERETGQPLFDIEDKPVPASDVPGRARLADAADSRKTAAVCRAVVRRDERHRHRRGESRVGAGSVAKGPARPRVQSAEL